LRPSNLPAGREEHFPELFSQCVSAAVSLCSIWFCCHLVANIIWYVFEIVIGVVCPALPWLILVDLKCFVSLHLKMFRSTTIGFSTPQVVNSVWFYCCYRFVGNAHFLDVLTQQTAHAIHKDHKDMKFMKISVMNIFMCAHNHIHEHSAPQFQYPTDFPCQGRYFFCTLDRRHLAIGDLNGVLWTDFTHIYLICCTTFFCIICIYIYTCMVLYFYLSIYLFN
jgi:hypothetical protein